MIPHIFEPDRANNRPRVALTSSQTLVTAEESPQKVPSDGSREPVKSQ